MATESANTSSEPTGPARVRFAPSPTGTMHIGGVRTALYNWILARKTGGQFILRIEDTDQSRFVSGATEDIMASLRWLGLDWDEGPDVGGPHGHYVQSERTSLYADAAERLIASGAAYMCDCTPERLDAVRKRQTAARQPPGYDGRCRNRPREELEQSKSDGLAVVVRLRVPDRESLTFKDVVRGDVTFDLSTLSDFVILKSDGMPTYHLAHVVDDFEMQITHVIRAEEWISSTPRHLLIHRGLGIEPPVYVHVPLLLGKDRSKLSKRHGARSVLEYRDEGYLPDAIFNFLALLGWSPGDDREVMSRTEIVESFTLGRILDSPAIFDTEKLEWLNGVYIRDMSDEQLAEAIVPMLERPQRDGGLPDSVTRPIDRDYLSTLVPLVHERLKRTSEAAEALRFFFTESVDPDPEMLPARKTTPADAAEALKIALELAEAITPFEPEHLEHEYRALAEQAGMKPGQLFTPIRVAVTGATFAPPLFDTMAAIGRERCVARMRHALGLLGVGAGPA